MSGREADMDSPRTLTMSAKELDRLEVLGRVVERRLMQRQGAEQLGLNLRQWMIDAGRWVPRAQRPRRAHPIRSSRFGRRTRSGRPGSE